MREYSAVTIQATTAGLVLSLFGTSKQYRFTPFTKTKILFCFSLNRREGQSDMTWDAARSYCQRKGMRMISFDSQDEIQHFFGIIGNENTPFIWAGATKSG